MSLRRKVAKKRETVLCGTAGSGSVSQDSETRPKTPLDPKERAVILTYVTPGTVHDKLVAVSFWVWSGRCQHGLTVWVGIGTASHI